MVAQDVAIDFSTGASGIMPKIDKARSQLASVANVIDYVTDSSAAVKTLDRLAQAGGDLAAIGKDAIFTTGKQIGIQYVEVMKIAESLMKTDPNRAKEFKALYLPKIDQQLILGRMKIQDVEDIMKGISSGIQESSASVDEFKDILSRLSDENLNKLAPSEVKEVLIKNFGADETHAYATLSRVHSTGEIIDANMEAQKRIRYASKAIDPSLSSFEYTEDARKISDYLLKKHFDEVSRIENFAIASKELSDTAINDLSLRKIYMGDKITAEIKEAARISGVSVEEMINTLKKRSYQLGQEMVYDDIEYFPGKSEYGNAEGNLRTLMNAADVKRKRKYYNRFFIGAGNEKYGEDASRAMTMLGQDVKIQNIQEKAKNILTPALENIEEYNRLLNLNGAAAVDILALLSEDDDIISNIFGLRDSKKSRETLTNALEAVRAEINFQALDDTLKSDLGFIPPTTTAGEPTTSLGEDIRRVISGEEPSVMKAQFKKINEFIKDGALKKLFEQNKLFRNSAIAAGALIVGSFAYSGAKDRTGDDIQGPPLLPGGSSYENDYPKRLSEIPQIGRTNYNPNIDYKVNLYGSSRDVSNFRQQAMGLGKFNMNTTMYRRAPQLGVDPYREVASSF